MNYFLILANATLADNFSKSSWTPGEGDTITTHRWGCRIHPIDGRAALMIPEEDFNFLTENEINSLVNELTDDWKKEEIE